MTTKPKRPVDPSIETMVFEHGLPVSMPVTGIDLSLTSTAVALLTPEALIVKRYRSGDMRGIVRLNWITANVTNMVTTGQSQLALIEGYSFGSTTHAHSLGELGGCVRMGLGLLGVPMAVAAPGCWKKALTGNGAPKGKGAITLELFKRYGIEIAQDDMADAASLALVAAMATGQITTLTQLQKAGLSKVDYIEPLPMPKVRHRVRPEEVTAQPGEELREKPATDGPKKIATRLQSA